MVTHENLVNLKEAYLYLLYLLVKFFLLSYLYSRQQHGRSETEEYSSESESESEDEEELQIILEDLQRQNEELEVSVGGK